MTTRGKIIRCFRQFVENSKKSVSNLHPTGKFIQNRPCNLYDEMDLSKEYERSKTNLSRKDAFYSYTDLYCNNYTTDTMSLILYLSQLHTFAGRITNIA